MRREGFEGERPPGSAIVAQDDDQAALRGEQLRDDPVAATATAPEENLLRLPADIEEERVGLPLPTQHDEGARSVHG